MAEIDVFKMRLEDLRRERKVLRTENLRLAGQPNFEIKHKANIDRLAALNVEIANVTALVSHMKAGGDKNVTKEFVRNLNSRAMDAPRPEPPRQAPARQAAIDIDRIRHDIEYFCNQVLEILYRPGMNPDFPDGGSGPFILNESQKQLAYMAMDALANGKPLRDIILKSRQLGCTTIILAIATFLCCTIRNYRYMMIIDKDDHMYTKRDQMLKWIAEAHRRFPDIFPEVERKEGRVVFLTNGSQLHFESAQAGNPGTSEFIHFLHMSEKAKWVQGRAEYVDQSVAPSVPRAARTFVYDESTPLGFDEFYRKWDRAYMRESEDRPVFLSWFLSLEYSKETSEAFNFLNDDAELFDTYFDKVAKREITLNEEGYAAKYALTYGQILWRRHKIKSDFKGKRHEFDKEFPTTPDHAWRNALQGFFPSALRKRFAEIRRRPVFQGHLTCDKYDVERPREYTQYTPRLTEDNVTPTLRVWKFPEEGQRYFIGADFAEGKSLVSDGDIQLDSHSVRLLDEDGYLCASISDQVPAEHFWLQLLLLGIWYNHATINGEKNGPGKTVWAFFKLTRYPHPLVWPGDGEIEERIWTRVSQANRLTLLHDMRSALFDDAARCPDEEFHEQAEHFGRKPGAKLAAPQGLGRHDDEIFGQAHAEACRLLCIGEMVVRAAPIAPVIVEQRDPETEGYRLSDLWDPTEPDWETPWR